MILCCVVQLLSQHFAHIFSRLRAGTFLTRWACGPYRWKSNLPTIQCFMMVCLKANLAYWSKKLIMYVVLPEISQRLVVFQSWSQIQEGAQNYVTIQKSVIRVYSSTQLQCTPWIGLRLRSLCTLTSFWMVYIIRTNTLVLFLHINTEGSQQPVHPTCDEDFRSCGRLLRIWNRILWLANAYTLTD